MTEDYRETVRREIDAWLEESEGKGWVSYISDIVTSPILWVTEKTVPDAVMTAMVKTLRGALSMINDGAQWTYSTAVILESFKQFGHAPKCVEDIRMIPMEDCDRVAQPHITSNKFIAAVEGGGTGLGGFAMMAADLPAIMAINFRMISQIAACYGYDTTLETEKPFVLNVLHLGNATDRGAKTAVMAELARISADVARRKTWEKLEEYAIVRLIEELAEKLGIRLTKRKLGQLIPILGASVGAGMNYVFTHDNGMAAYMAYRKRRLEEVAGLLTAENTN